MASEKVVSMADKAGDSRLWSAEQMLDELLEEVKTGKVKPKRMLVLFWEPLEGNREQKSYRAVNFTNAEYIGYLASAAHDALHEWKER